MDFQLNVRQVYRYQEDGIDKYFVYIGDSDISNEIFAGEIGLPDDHRPHLVLETLTDMVLFLDEIKIIKANTISDPLYIKGERVIVPAFEFNSLINSICSILLNKYTLNITSKSTKNYDSTTKCLKDIVFPEKLIRLLMWNNKKSSIKFDKKKVLRDVYKYNVYFAYLGTNVGSEIDKLRPVLIWKTHTNTENKKESSYYVFPISTKIPSKNYYYNVPVVINGNKNIIKINDGKRISIKRIEKPLVDNITKKTVKISEETVEQIKIAIEKYFL